MVRATGTHLKTLPRGHVRTNSISYSPNGKTIASGGGGGFVQLWDVATGTHLKALVGHTRSVESVYYSPDGEILASGSKDGTILLWDVSSVE